MALTCADFFKACAHMSGLCTGSGNDTTIPTTRSPGSKQVNYSTNLPFPVASIFIDEYELPWPLCLVTRHNCGPTLVFRMIINSFPDICPTSILFLNTTPQDLVSISKHAYFDINRIDGLRWSTGLGKFPMSRGF